MITVPISVGELIDKLSILQVKKNKITCEKKLFFIHKEFELLFNLSIGFLDQPEILVCYQNLVTTNSNLWELEDTIRNLEQKNEFNEVFIETSRRIYKTNDERFKIKDMVNRITNSEIQEQKSYQDYSETESLETIDKWIFESPDGGQTIYKRPFGSPHDKREKITNE